MGEFEPNYGVTHRLQLCRKPFGFPYLYFAVLSHRALFTLFTFVAFCPSSVIPKGPENGFYVGPIVPCFTGCPAGFTRLHACNPGYNMNGSAVSTCQSSGVWYPSIGNCVPEPGSEYNFHLYSSSSR